MSETRIVGCAGDVLVTVESNGQVDISQEDDLVVLNLTDAVCLAELLDEAIALAKGEGVKLDKGLA